jgi:ABC-type transporter Mla maintaining outer membrane lipid asymmetry ATPase subunit MlaF
MPSSLSGGQRRRVGIGRAMASKPGLMLFDDSTTGLDPVISATVDDEIVKLRDLQQVTALVVTQQIRDAFYIATHRAVGQNGDLRLESVDDEQGRSPSSWCCTRAHPVPRDGRGTARVPGRIPAAVSLPDAASVVGPMRRSVA